MSLSAAVAAPRPELPMADYAAGVAAAEELLLAARSVVRQRVGGAKDDAQQATLHGFAWLATYVEAVKQLVAWGERLTADGRFGALEAGILSIGVGEYLAQISGGISMNIKAHKTILEQDAVSDLFVCGSGSDESLAIGACYKYFEQHSEEVGSGRIGIEPLCMYLGPAWNPGEIRACLVRSVEKRVVP